MSNTIQTFDYEAHNVTVETDDSGQLWFRADEVCAVLEFGNMWDALKRHCDEDDLGKTEAIDNLGRRQQVNTINESGLYALILRSHKPKAQGFKRWVTSQVLPSIRQTGSYQHPRAPRANMIEVPREQYFALVDKIAALPLQKPERPRITKVTPEEVLNWRAQNNRGVSKADIARQAQRDVKTVGLHLNYPRFV